MDGCEACGEMCGREGGGGSMDKVDHDTCKGEGGGGGGMSTDDAFANISELRKLERPRTSSELLNSG